MKIRNVKAKTDCWQFEIEIEETTLQEPPVIQVAVDKQSGIERRLVIPDGINLSPDAFTCLKQTVTRYLGIAVDMANSVRRIDGLGNYPRYYQENLIRAELGEEEAGVEREFLSVPDVIEGEVADEAT